MIVVAMVVSKQKEVLDQLSIFSPHSKQVPGAKIGALVSSYPLGSFPLYVDTNVASDPLIVE